MLAAVLDVVPVFAFALAGAGLGMLILRGSL